MEVVEGCNIEIVNYFSKFKHNNNYENLLEKFKELTRIRLRGTIDLQEYKLPELGPSEDLQQFPSLLKDWNDEDILEIKNVIKLYDAGEIESLEEAIILIHVLKNKSDKYPKILDVILEDLEKQQFSGIDTYNQLLELEKIPEDSIIYNALWNFFMTLFS